MIEHPVLMQEHDDKKKMILASPFRGAELNYSATKRELQALVWALLRMEQLLKGGRFHVYTDRKALTFLPTEFYVITMDRYDSTV